MPWPPHYAYAFDVTTETWAELSNPSHPAFYGCLTGNDTHLFFIGGVDNAANYIALKGIQMYNIHSNSWSYDTSNDLPIDGWQHGYCAMMNDDIYIFGGEGAIEYEYLDSIYKWNGMWATISTVLPEPLFYGIAVAHLDSIYIIGGMDSNFNSNDAIYEFDTIQNIITNTYHMLWSLDSTAAGVINNKLYVFGGNFAGVSALTNDVQECDILPSSPQISANPSQSPVLNPANPTASPLYPTAVPTTSVQPTLAPITFNPSTSPVVNTVNPTTSPVHSTTAPSRPSTVDPTTSLQPTVAPITLNPTSLRASTTSLSTSPNESTKERNATETYQSSMSPTNVNTNASHRSSDNVLFIVLIVVGVVSAAVVSGLRCYWKRKKKTVEEERKTVHMDNKGDSSKIEEMMHNLNHIPHVVLITTGGALDEIEGSQNVEMNKENMEQGEMRYTNEGPSDIHEVISDMNAANKSKTTDGNTVINRWKHSAKMTRDHVPDKATKGDAVDSI
eukprot:8042_1